MDPRSAPLTFLFTDIEGSSSLWEQFPEAMDAALARHDGILREIITRHGGRVFKSLGDGLGSVFDDAAIALTAAIAVQRAMLYEAWNPLTHLRVRVALHMGPARPRDGDYYGTTVNRVARVLGVARGGEILLGERAANAVRPHLSPDVSLHDLGDYYLRGMSQPENVFQVILPDLPARQETTDVAQGLLRAEPLLLDGLRASESAPDSTGQGPVVAPALRVSLLGTFSVVVGEREISPGAWGRQKARQLFKYLLGHPHRTITIDEALELFWPNSGQREATSTLGTALSVIRAKLREAGLSPGFDPIERHDRSIRIRPSLSIWVDADAFEDTLDRAAGQADDPYRLLEEADRIYTGEFLPEDRFDTWTSERREHLQRRWIALQLELARHRAWRHDAPGAESCLRRVLDADTGNEQAVRSLMLLLARQGRRRQALDVYDTLVRSLADELAIKPSHETLALYDVLRSGAPLPPLQPPAPQSRPRDPDAPYVASYPFPVPVRFVGRQPQLDALLAILERGKTSRQVVLVSAQAGTGKSTLLGALVQRARRAGALCLVGGGYEGEGVVPLGAFHEALGDYLLSHAPGRVQAELQTGVEDLTLVIPELRQHLALADRPSQPSLDRGGLFSAIHGCLRTLSTRQPVLLCLEDLHAVDAASLALLQYLVRQMRRQPIVIIGTFRAEELRAGRPLADLVTALRREGAEQLDLQPLSQEQTSRLAGALLEGEPSGQLSTALYRATGGNPLFIEQLLLALREDGRLDRRHGAWYQQGGISGSVPTIVRSVIGSRLERLEGRVREMLALAAVLGQTFDYGALLAASNPADEATLLEDLDEAFHAEVLQETPSGWAFVHALLREVVYAGISAPRRMLLHARAGEALERLAGSKADERAAELAHHFASGGRSTHVREKAIRYSLEAGRRANALSAYREALDHFTRTCDLVSELGEEDVSPLMCDALEGRGQAARNLGAWQDCVESMRAFLAVCDDPVRRARARGAITRALEQDGETVAALAEAEAGLLDLDPTLDSPEIIGVRLGLQRDLALLYYLGGRYRALTSLAQEMLELAQGFTDPNYPSVAHMVMGWAHMAQGQVESALHHNALALEAAERIGDKLDIAVKHVNLGIQNYRGCRFAAARAELEQAIAIFRAAMGERRALHGIQMLGRVWLAEGNLARAEEHAQLAESIVADTDDRWAAECQELQGMIHAAQGGWEQAESCFSSAVNSRERAGHLAGLVDSLLGLGLVFERRGDWSRAKATYDKACDVARTMDTCPQTVAAQRQVGRLILRSGDPILAQARIEAACTMAGTMPHSMEYAPTILVAAELRLQDDPGEASSLAELALASNGSVELRIEAHVLASEAHLLGHNIEPARMHANRAAVLAERLGTSYGLGLAYLAAGRLQAALGEAAAVTTLEVALQHFVAAQTPYEQSVTLRRLAQVMAEHHNDVERAEALRLDALQRLPVVV